MDELRRAAAALLAASLLAPPPAAAAGYRRAAAPLQGEARVPAFDVSVGGADERLSAAALLSAAPLSLDGPAPSIESVAPAPTRAVALPALIEEAGPKEQLVQEKTPPATPTRTQPPAESGSAPKVGSEAFQRSLSRSVAAPTARLAQDVPTMTFGSAKTAAEEPFEAPARRGDGPAEPVGAGLPAMLASSGLGRSDAAAGKTTPRGEPPAAPAPARA
ncbi:MAG TPA: hypothetical protein VNI01_02980, partial [Elusimicrobiota bacterium]|nr:hypothetical protein [Elusimicrobiota bacterium]